MTAPSVAEEPGFDSGKIRICGPLPAVERPPMVSSHNAVRPFIDSPDLPGSRLAAGAPFQSEPGLKDIGEESTTITRAREAAYEILARDNACSAWFRKIDWQTATTFRSLIFVVDDDGAKHVTRERDDRGSWIEHGPYVAKTRDGTGPGSTIIINGNGAFFRARADVYKIEWFSRYEIATGDSRHLHVGRFWGGTLEAQVITLLHELAHVIGRLPADDSSVVGLARSQENTNLILHHCQSEALAAGRTTRSLAKLSVNPSPDKPFRLHPQGEENLQKKF